MAENLSYRLDEPPSKALRGSDPGSFAQKTMKKRLPVTVTNVIDDVHQAFCHLDPDESGLKIEQGKRIVHKLSELRHFIQRDKPVFFIFDELEDSKLWQKAQGELEPGYEYTYHSLTWLFSECLVYRNIYSIIQTNSTWENYDPFRIQKENSFKNSQRGVEELALRLAPVINSGSNEDQDRVLFIELIQLSLWGNRADLSLLNELSAQNDFHQFSDLSSENVASSYNKILADDTKALWSYLSTLRDQRFDIVLDNAGFELFTDLVFADWLVQRGYANEVHFHGKAIPWFVSDTMVSDLEFILKACSEHPCPEVQILGKRWSEYYHCKVHPVWFFHAHPFWTTPYPYWHLFDVAPELFEELSKCSLIIFKGDLNYRKLVYDCDWRVDTPFSKAIGPLALTLAGFASYPPVLALRTTKSDPIVGLEGGVSRALELNASEPDWRIAGKYGLIQFHRN